MTAFFNFLKEYEVVGPILGVVFSVLLVEWLLPKYTQKRRDAKNKLINFYNVAYAFVKIREDFSVKIDNKMHTKQNCGYFHSFNGFNGVGLIFLENDFFEYVSANFQFIDNSLRDLFVEYFKARSFDTVQKGSGCEDSKLIRLRKQIEAQVIIDYKKYEKELERFQFIRSILKIK